MKNKELKDDHNTEKHLNIELRFHYIDEEKELKEFIPDFL